MTSDKLDRRQTNDDIELSQHQLRFLRLKRLLWSTSIALSIDFFFILIFDRGTDALAIIAITMIVVGLIIIIFRSGKVDLATTLFLWTATISMTLLIVTGDGPEDSAFLAYPIILIVAGMLGTSRMFFSLLGIILLSATFMGFAAAYGWVDFDERNSGLGNMIDSVLILCVTGFAVWLLSGDLKTAFNRLDIENQRVKSAEGRLRNLVREKTILAEQAQQANKAKMDFLATMSHELRTPLNAIIGFSEMLQVSEVDAPPDRREEYVAHIHNSGKHLLHLIGDILDFSKADAGKLETEDVDFFTDELFEECLNFLEPNIRGRNLEVVTDFAEFEIRTDRRLLKQILLNLISNAVKFNVENGKLTLKVGKDVDGHLSFIVEDTGIGMSEDEVERARNPFVQINSTYARTSEGTGLGLSLVDRFSDLIGARVDIQSTKEKGTRIEIRFPDTILVLTQKET